MIHIQAEMCRQKHTDINTQKEANIQKHACRYIPRQIYKHTYIHRNTYLQTDKHIQILIQRYKTWTFTLHYIHYISPPSFPVSMSSFHRSQVPSCSFLTTQYIFLLNIKVHLAQMKLYECCLTIMDTANIADRVK